MYKEMMQYFKTKDWKTILFLIPFTVFLLLFVSNDSYLYDMYGKNDSTIFFMSGKAWMNGMIPYVDFSDSKGPLLWLIYGVGYLISHYNYIGVFWVTCVFYFFIFYYIFKTANLFLNDRNLSLLATGLMSLSFFDPLVHNDIRAEDFSQLFIVLALYCSCKAIYRGPASSQVPPKYAFVIGLCIAACLMIKFTIAVMLFVFGVYVIIVNTKKVNDFVTYVWYMFVGSSAIILPFIVIFLIEGNLTAFLYEYFVRTFITVNHTNDSLNYFEKMISYFTRLTPFVIFVTSLFATLLFAREMSRHKYFPLVSFLWFYLITIQNGIWYHYYVTCTSFLLFGVIPILLMVKRRQLSVKVKPLILIIFVVCSSINVLRNILYTKSFFLCDTEQRTVYYDYASLMSQVSNPKIVIVGMEFGYGAPVGSLPGCTYWARQTGATQDMEDNQIDAIKDGKVDFVLISQSDIKSYDMLKCLGYSPNYIDNSPLVVFSKKKVTNVVHISVSPMDILLKRNLYNL